MFLQGKGIGKQRLKGKKTYMTMKRDAEEDIDADFMNSFSIIRAD